MSEQLQMLFPIGLIPRLADDVAENRPLVDIGPINRVQDPPTRQIKFLLPKQEGCDPTEICFEDGRIGEWRLLYDSSGQAETEASRFADEVEALEHAAKRIVSRFGPEILLQDLRDRFPEDEFPDLPQRSDCKASSEFFTLPIVRAGVMRSASEELLRVVRTRGLLPADWNAIRRRVFYEVDVSTIFSARYQCNDGSTFSRRFWMTYQELTAFRLPDEHEILGAASKPYVVVSALDRFIESPTFAPTLNVVEWAIEFGVPEYREDCLCRYRVRTTDSNMRFVVPGDDSYEANLFAYIMSQLYVRRVVDDDFRATPGFTFAPQFFEIDPSWNECYPGQSVSVRIPTWQDHPEFEDPAESFANGFADVIEAMCGPRPDHCGERTWELGLLIDLDYEVELECDQVDRGIGSYCVIINENTEAELNYSEECEMFAHEGFNSLWQDVTIGEDGAQKIEGREFADSFIQAAEAMLELISHAREFPLSDEAAEFIPPELLEVRESIPCTICDVVLAASFLFGLRIDAFNTIVGELEAIIYNPDEVDIFELATAVAQFLPPHLAVPVLEVVRMLREEDDQERFDVDADPTFFQEVFQAIRDLISGALKALTQVDRNVALQVLFWGFILLFGMASAHRPQRRRPQRKRRANKDDVEKRQKEEEERSEQRLGVRCPAPEVTRRADGAIQYKLEVPKDARRNGQPIDGEQKWIYHPSGEVQIDQIRVDPRRLGGGIFLMVCFVRWLIQHWHDVEAITGVLAVDNAKLFRDHGGGPRQAGESESDAVARNRDAFAKTKIGEHFARLGIPIDMVQIDRSSFRIEL